jgi:hypothetical protein
MKVFFATPTGASVGKSIAQTINVVLESLARACREFDSDEDAPGFDYHTHFVEGSRISRSFVALSTAALLKGKARGVTFRQSSSWSFQCGLDGSPDSPSGIPC